MVAAVGAVAWHARSPAQPQPAAGDPWAGYTHRWSRLPPPPQARTGVALAWTGSELVSLGGAVPGIGRPARDGYAFDPRTGHWSHIPPAPGPGRIDAYAVWTGSEVLLVGGYGYGKQQPANVALDPATNTWRRIAKAPLPLADARGQGLDGPHADRLGRPCRSHASRSGAEYVPATNRWHRIANAPIALKSPSAAWTGSQMIVFGSSIGASYDPHTNTWQRLPPSTLAPEASSVGWIGRRAGGMGLRRQHPGLLARHEPLVGHDREPVWLRRVLSAERRHGDEHVRVVLRRSSGRRPHSEQLGARLWRRHRPHGAVLAAPGSSSSRPPRSRLPEP